jgi:diguanylate cyclase (GGDEF)-like protein/PAS domain S-box-containing protein
VNDADARQATGRSERDYRSVVEGAHDAFVAMDAGGFIIDWNPRAEATFGWRRDEVLGRVLADTIVPERHRDAHWSGLQRYLETGEGPVIDKRIEIEALHREGFEFPVEMTISVHRSGETPYFNAFLHDISDRRRAALIVDLRHAVTRTLAQAESADCVIAILLRELGERMEWEYGAFWRPAAEGASLVCTDVWSLEEERLAGFAEASKAIELEEGVGLPGRVWASRRPAFVVDVTRDGNFPRAAAAIEAGLHGAICFPVANQDVRLGTIEFLSAAIGHADEKLLDALASIGAEVGGHLAAMRERSELLSRMETMARTDELTGLPNRRAWEDQLQRELARARRSGERFSIAILDLDHFKDFNDSRGHQAGDELLKDAGAAWPQAVRASDFLARYGGEEFALLLPGCPPACGSDAVERIRSATPRGETCSAGLAAWDGEESAEALVARADAALYEAKRAGRDRIVTAEDAEA